MSNLLKDLEALDEMEFDMDDLYKEGPKNSDYPIETDKPEVVEARGCADGGCTL